MYEYFITPYYISTNNHIIICGIQKNKYRRILRCTNVSEYCIFYNILFIYYIFNKPNLIYINKN